QVAYLKVRPRRNYFAKFARPEPPHTEMIFEKGVDGKQAAGTHVILERRSISVVAREEQIGADGPDNGGIGRELTGMEAMPLALPAVADIDRGAISGSLR